MKTKLLFLIAFISGIAIYSQQTIVVTNSNDNGPGSLRQAVIDAAPGDRIIFNDTAGSESNPIMLNSTINITKPISVLGRVSGLPITFSVTKYIKMNANERHFFIENASDVSFADIVFTDGHSEGAPNTLESYGGAILAINTSSSSTTSLRLNSCVFSNNVALEGGAITALSTTLDLYDCTFNNNSATYRGGALTLGGPPANPGSTLISRTKFISNAAGTYGGAIFRTNPYINIYNSLFHDNSANYGGAIALESSSSAAALEERNNTFAYNKANTNASSIYLGENQQLKTYNSIHIDDANAPNAIFGENNAAIDFKRLFSNNGVTVPAVTGSGPYTQVQGQIAFYDTPNKDFRVLAFSSTTDAGDGNLSNYINETDLDGNPRQVGSQYDLGAYENTCENQIVTQTSGTEYGSFTKAILNLCENKTVYFDPITNNTPITIPGTSIIYKNNVTISGNGKDKTILQMQSGVNERHLFSDGNNLTVQGIHFKDGSAQVISGNPTSSSGGAILLANANLNITASKFTNNTSTEYGGAIIIVSGNFTTKNSEYINNSAINGGAVLISQGNIESTNNLYAKNSGTTQGGAIYLLDSPNSIFTNDALVDNTSGDRSGLAAFNNSVVTFQNSNILNPGLDIGSDTSSSITANYSNFDANYGLTGTNQTFFTNPGFIDPTNNNYRLGDGSPLFDIGNNIYNNETIDLDNNARIINSTIDLGPYESMCPLYSSSILYVKANVSGGANDGTSWDNAFTNLSHALKTATSCSSIQEIWVAAGTYKPGSLETDNFDIPQGLTVLGGFIGNETNANERNWANNPTVLSGDINNSNSANEGDSHTIVKMNKNNSTLDGFIIQYSYADGIENSSPAIGRSGAGVYNSGNNTITHCIFHNNRAHGNSANGIGGAVVSFSGLLNINNSLFFNNTASANGGAISIENGTVNLTNATIANNNAEKGGGIHFYNGNLEAINAIFTNNSGVNGNINNDGGSGSGSVSYSVFYNSTSGNSGSVPVGVTNNGNNIINTDPIYNSINNVNGYKLYETSPVINLGSNSAITQTLDLAGNTRIFNTTVDIGAYESQSTLSINTINTIDFKVYPNPVNNILNIKTTGQEYNYSLYNIQGQEILKANNQTSKTIDVSKLPSGVYMLKLSSDNNSQSFKIIKQN